MQKEQQRLSPTARLVRSLAAAQLQAVMAELLNVRFALAADFIGEHSFADLLHRRLSDLQAEPAKQPPTGQNHSTVARRMVRDVSTAHMQDALTELIELHRYAVGITKRREFFVRYALLQIDNLVELATRVAEHDPCPVNPVALLSAASASQRKRERVAA